MQALLFCLFWSTGLFHTEENQAQKMCGIFFLKSFSYYIQLEMKKVPSFIRGQKTGQFIKEAFLSAEFGFKRKGRAESCDSGQLWSSPLVPSEILFEIY